MLAETRLASAAASTRINGPFDPNKTCGLKWLQHLALTLVVFGVSTSVGLVLAANVADGGLMHDVDPLWLATPFVAGPVCFLSVLCYHCLRLAWRKRTDWRLQRKEQADISLIEKELPELVLNAADATKLVTTTLNQMESEVLGRVEGKMMAAAGRRYLGPSFPDPSEYIVTIHPDGTSDRGIMAGVDGFPADSIHTAKPYLTNRFALFRSLGTPVCRGWPSHALYAGMASGFPVALASTCPLLLVLGHSYVVSFIPAVLAVFIALVAIVCAICEHTDTFTRRATSTDYLSTVLSVWPFLCLMAFFILYPLARDGHLASTSKSNWAIIMIPIWLLALFLTTLHSTVIFMMTKSYEWRRMSCYRKALFLMLGLLSVAAVLVFDVCLVGLWYKAARESMLLSYTGYTGIMCSCATIASLFLFGMEEILNRR